ncbi:FUSC family protein [Sphingobacterium daejeonense]|uniref:FUSC family protein n=1 Tax=Sphingobacterium daejeonense TaxID=371142 RepID=UPI0010C2483A|nr:FUSC family membrane protein [Sphingobacterium daejeonense]VTP95546.1 Inner membrane protein yccS [Sphingobacterium daejeonense]
MIKAAFSQLASFLRTESSLDALRNILVVIIPSTLIFYFIDGHIAIAFAVGALLAALTDVPGNKNDKLSTAAYCLPIFFITALSISFALHFHSWTIILMLGIFGFIYTIIALLGFRINVVGNLGLIVASFTIGLRPVDPMQFSLSLTAGALFFFVVCIIQVYLSPYRSLRFAVESGIKTMAKLISLKVDCYDEKVPLTKAYKELSALHIKVSDQLETIRTILLRDKKLHSEKDQETKIWLAKLYQLIDLYELLMAIDNDYEQIRETLKGGNTLKLIRKSLSLLSKETKSLRISSKVRKSNPSRRLKLEELLLQLEMEEAEGSPAKWNLICSISTQLRHISDILQNIQVKQVYQDNTLVDSKNYIDFVAPQSNIKTIQKNLSFKSPIFSYAVRMAILLMAGGLIGYFLPEYRYASWILLTIILVARPSYHITQKRNYQRIIGSVIGIAISLTLLLLIKNLLILVIIAAFCLYLFLLFNKPNYLVCCIFITITILVGQHIHEGEIHDILGSRFAFTLLGSIFAVLGCLAIPINHYRSVEHSTKSLIQHFRSYSEKIQESFNSHNLNYYDLRLFRRFTQASLAQTYDSLDQLAKEPLKGKFLKEDILHFQTLAYRINALLVGLSVNLTKLGISLEQEIMSEKINFINSLIDESEMLSQQLATKKEKKNLSVKLKTS